MYFEKVSIPPFGPIVTDINHLLKLLNALTDKKIDNLCFSRKLL